MEAILLYYQIKEFKKQWLLTIENVNRLIGIKIYKKKNFFKNYVIAYEAYKNKLRGYTNIKKNRQLNRKGVIVIIKNQQYEQSNFNQNQCYNQYSNLINCFEYWKIFTIQLTINIQGMQTISKNQFYLNNRQSEKNNSTHTSNLILTQNKKCPVQLIIDYDYGQLKFIWDFAHVQFQQGLSFRFILIIDSQSYSTTEMIFYIALLFYKKLKLGDFFKVLLTNRSLKMDWIEKTSQRLQKSYFITQNANNSSIIKTCEQALKIGKKFDDGLSICLFTKRLGRWSSQVIQKLIKYNSQKEFCYGFQIFNQLDSQEPKFARNKYHLNFDFYNYKNNDLDEKFKYFFFQQNKMRILSAQIKLKCLNGDVFLRNSNTYSWTSQKDVLSKKLYALYNHIKYQCGLIINSFKMQKIGFQVEFNIETLSHTKYKMTSIFYISVQHPAESIDQIRKIMEEEFRYNQYSEMPKSQKIISTPNQKVLIQQKLNQQQYVTYQRSIFLPQ